MQTESINTTDKQREYVERLEDAGFDYGMVVAGAFVEGMRDVGYKHTGTALDELIDNSEEAGATRVMVALGYDELVSEKKPAQIAVIDDGHGMEPRMIRASVLWGGTHRANSREGFGRYGFGLPSSCASQGRRFEVFSRVGGADWYSVVVDLDDIRDGRYHMENGKIVVPKAERSELPEWVRAKMLSKFDADNMEHGTVVLISKLDRLTWKTTSSMTQHLLEHLGVTYRNMLRRCQLFVHDAADPTVEPTAVDPVDPLFLNPDARYYDDNHLRAEGVEPDPTVIEVYERDGRNKTVIGRIRVRYSLLPLGFNNKDGRMTGKKETLLAGRFGVMKDHNGFIVLRNGRQIDLVNRNPWDIAWQYYTLFFKVEVDFDPSLDEEFGVTTSKQQISFSDRVWQLLEQAGVKRTITSLRTRIEHMRGAKNQEEERPQEGEARASEEVMDKTADLLRKPDVPPDEASRRKVQVDQEIQRRAEQTGRTVAEIQREFEAQVAGSRFRVEFEDNPGAPFYRWLQAGGQLRLIVNRQHLFFTDVYMAAGATPRLRAALELLLFVLADCEADAQGDIALLYESERQEWSRRLRMVLQLLDRDQPIEREVEAAADAAAGGE